MVGLTQKEIKKLGALKTGVTVLTMLLQQLQYVGKHLLRSVQTPNKVQMVPVFDVSMKYQFWHLSEEDGYVFRIRQRVLSP